MSIAPDSTQMHAWTSSIPADQLTGLAKAALLLNLAVFLFAGQLPEGAIGFTLRYTSVLSSLAIAGIGFTSPDARSIARAAAIYVPFAIAGVCASVLGAEIVASFNLLTRWLILLSFALTVGIRFDEEETTRLLIRGLLVGFIISIAVALLLPDVGLQVYGYRLVWRGLFAHKNDFGWAAVMGLLLAVTMGKYERPSLRLMLVCVSVAALVGSNSVASLAVAGAAVGYWLCLGWLDRAPVSPGVILLSIATVIVVTALAALTFGETVLGYFDRDTSFTGRPEIWRAFFAETQKHWLLGTGAGSISVSSPTTLRVSNDNSFDGQTISHPHNTYLAVFGDAGIVGLTAFLVLVLYTTFISPAYFRTPQARTAAAFGFALVFGGLVETHDVYADTIGVMLTALSWAIAYRARQVLEPY